MIYRDALVLKKMDWCSGSGTKTATERGIYQIIKIFKAGDPNTVHECPYEVSY